MRNDAVQRTLIKQLFRGEFFDSDEWLKEMPYADLVDIVNLCDAVAKKANEELKRSMDNA